MDITLNQLDVPDYIENMQLPSNELLNFYALKEKRIFYIDFEIDITILEIQREIILINLQDSNIPIDRRTPIKLLIDSPGGFLSETMSLIATIQMSKTPVWTINVSSAYSGAAGLLISGSRRFAMPYSRAMIHTGQAELGGTYEQVEAQQREYKYQVERMGTFIINNTNIDAKLYKKNTKGQDWYMDDGEQLKYGLVDEIVGNIFDLLE